MLFNSFEFIFLFLPATLAVYFLIASRKLYDIAIFWLVAASLFFYGWWNPVYVLLLVFSVLFNYTVGLGLLAKDNRKYLLVIGILMNLGLLGYFKYTNFFIDNVNELFDSDFHVQTIILPLAISFFTFQQIAYLVDVYKREADEHNFIHYSLFVTFFPQLIAGPIVHHKEILPQFAREATYHVNLSNLNIGFAFFVIGLFKKVVLADSVAQYSTPVFALADAGETISFFDAWVAALAYTMQLYFDFSGYADMAIGLARMFGIVIPLNFNSPYKADSIIEFWRRWHMTLSRFLRDYLYIPIGGNRRGSRHVNLLVTMLLGGLWHGAAWNFVIWGGLHGLYLITNHAWRSLVTPHLALPRLMRILFTRPLAIGTTFFAVVIAWVFFRAETLPGAYQVLSGMFGANGIVLPGSYASLVPGFLHGTFEFGLDPNFHASVLREDRWTWISCLLGLVLFLPNTQKFMLWLEFGRASQAQRKEVAWRLFVTGALLGFFLFVSLNIMVGEANSEFIYFNF